jgi:hypothetical protein
LTVDKPSKVKERAGDLALVERLYQSLKPVLDELALNQFQGFCNYHT